MANYHPGISHLAGKDWMNMYQFARAVAGVFDMDSSLVNPVPVSAGRVRAGPQARYTRIGLYTDQS